MAKVTNLNPSLGIERDVRTYVDLFCAARLMLKIAKDGQCQVGYTSLSSLLSWSFTFEAYTNMIGEFKFKLWVKNDCGPTKYKYKLLCKHFNVTFDFSRCPYKPVKALFEFSNSIVHGRADYVHNKAVNVSDVPKTIWEKYCTLENAQRAEEDISELITEINKAAGLGDFPFSFDSASYLFDQV